MTSPGQSSTTGILIALDQFNQVSYHPADKTVDIGPGQIWDRVYGILADLGRGVVGGRVSGVGVGGYALGGGELSRTLQEAYWRGLTRHFF